MMSYDGKLQVGLPSVSFHLAPSLTKRIMLTFDWTAAWMEVGSLRIYNIGHQMHALETRHSF